MRLLMLVAAIAPAFVLLLHFWERDRFRSRSELVWSAVGLGALCCIPVAALVQYLIIPLLSEIVNIQSRAFVEAVFEAAIPEELAKYLVILGVFLNHPKVRTPIQLLLISTSVSIGFAALENLFYIDDFIEWESVALLRSLTAVPGHAFTGVVMGSLLAQARFGRKAMAIINYPCALLCPILLHGSYNFFAILATVIEVQPVTNGQGFSNYSEQLFAIVVLLECVSAWYFLLKTIKHDKIEISKINQINVKPVKSWWLESALRKVFWRLVVIILTFLSIYCFYIAVGSLELSDFTLAIFAVMHTVIFLRQLMPKQ